VRKPHLFGAGNHGQRIERWTEKLESERIGNMDHHRPRSHFLPETNWMNDPNGPCFFDGRYHMFYQYNPNGAFWGSMHWGHASSADLVHWMHEPIALAPDQPYDKDGVYSGCCVIHNGLPHILYTGTQPETQCLAVSNDNLQTWEKAGENPIIPKSPAPPEESELTGFRDPYVWQEDGAWTMVIGSGYKNMGGTALVYRSSDLKVWEYIGPLCIGNRLVNGEMWECPNFFRVGNKHLLAISPYGKVVYLEGSYKEFKFTEERQDLLDLGEAYYAPNSLVDPKGRLLIWGWMKERRDEAAQKKAGWSGCLTYPRELFRHTDGALGMRAVEEIKSLRENEREIPSFTLMNDQLQSQPGISGHHWELELEIDPGSARAVGFHFLASENGDVGARFTLDLDRKTAGIEYFSIRTLTKPNLDSGPVETLKPGAPLLIRAYLDHSVVEVFIDERHCLSSRIYAESVEDTQVAFFAQGSSAEVKKLMFWDLTSA